MIRIARRLAIVLFITVGLPWSGSTVMAEPEHDDEHQHTGHSDQLLVLLNHKLALEKLQRAFRALNHSNTTNTTNTSPTTSSNNTDDTVNTEQQHRNLRRQKHHLDSALPVLNAYIDIPASHYPNTSLYQQSLNNRAALLTDYGSLVSGFYAQLLGQ